MADIFISYASEDRSRVEPLAKALDNQGWSVFWDTMIPVGKTWRQAITEELKAAKCAVVIWSSASINSEFVHEEAEEAQERKIFVPVMIDKVKPPLGFRRLQSARLIKWAGESNHPEFEKLLESIEAILGHAPAGNLSESKTEPTVSSKPKITDPIARAHRKSSNFQKFGVLAGFVAAVLLIIGIWWWVSRQQVNEVRQELEKFDSQVLNLENAVAKVDKLEQLEEFTGQRNKLNNQVADFSEQAIKVGLNSPLSELQNRLKQIQIQLANREKELIAARKGKIFVATAPDNATVNLLNIDKPFKQGMGLEPGEYRLHVLSKGYEPQEKSIELGPGEEKIIYFELERLVITNSIGMKFVLIPAGSFTMGNQLSPEEVVRRIGGYSDMFGSEQPPHLVEITKPFYLQTTEVSQRQWKMIMDDNPSYFFKLCGDDCPVEKVSWVDSQKFISKLNQMEGTNKYRLPTEAEWEYACRAGTETAYSFGDEVDNLGEYAWYKDNSISQTHPVGKKKPNAWGLYDMHGNVQEWVQDWLGDYPSNSVVDPKGPYKGGVRGGSWSDAAVLLRSAYRNFDDPDLSYRYRNGFRVARDF